jgi:ubiquitin-small subunit ribosomal protein S27Ae
MADDKAQVKLKKTSKRSNNYEISSNTVKRKNKSCPKCGPGIFLAKHKDRVYCGKCSYVEFNSTEKNKEVADKKPVETFKK